MSKNGVKKLVIAATGIVAVTGLISTNPGLYEALLDSLLNGTNAFAFAYGEVAPQSTNNCAANEWNIEPVIDDVAPSADIYSLPTWRGTNPTSSINTFSYQDLSDTTNFPTAPTSFVSGTPQTTGFGSVYTGFTYGSSSTGDTLTLSDGSVLKTNLAEKALTPVGSPKFATDSTGNKVVVEQKWTQNTVKMSDNNGNVQLYPLDNIHTQTRVGDTITYTLLPWEYTTGLDLTLPFTVDILNAGNYGAAVVRPSDNAILYTADIPMLANPGSYADTNISYRITQNGSILESQFQAKVYAYKNSAMIAKINGSTPTTINLSDLLNGEELYANPYSIDKALTEANVMYNNPQSITVDAAGTTVTIPVLPNLGYYQAYVNVKSGTRIKKYTLEINTNTATTTPGASTIDFGPGFLDDYTLNPTTNGYYNIFALPGQSTNSHTLSSAYGLAANVQSYTLSFNSTTQVSTDTTSGVTLTLNNINGTIASSNTLSTGFNFINPPNIYLNYKNYGSSTIYQQLLRGTFHEMTPAPTITQNKVSQWILQKSSPVVLEQLFNDFNIDMSRSRSKYFAHTVSAQKSPAALASGTSLYGKLGRDPIDYNNFDLTLGIGSLGYNDDEGAFGTSFTDGIVDTIVNAPNTLSTSSIRGDKTTAHAFAFFPSLNNCTPPPPNVLTSGTVPTLSENPTTPNHSSTLTLTLLQPPAAAKPVVYTITTDNQCRVRTTGSGLGFSSTFVTTGQTTTTTILDVEAVNDGLLELPLHSCAISIISSSTNTRDNGLTANRTVQIQDYNLIVVPPTPNLNAPSGKMEVAKSTTKLAWKQTWFNNSNAVNLKTRITNTLPTGVTYTAGTLVCTVRGTSITDSCSFDVSTRNITWTGTLAADPAAVFAHISGSEQVLGYDANNSLNSLEIVFDSSPSASSYDVTNIATAFWDQNGDSIINNGDTNVQNNTPIIIKLQVVQEALLSVANTGAQYSIPSFSIIIIIVGVILAAAQIKKIRDGREYAQAKVPTTSIPQFSVTTNIDGLRRRK